MFLYPPIIPDTGLYYRVCITEKQSIPQLKQKDSQFVPLSTKQKCLITLNLTISSVSLLEDMHVLNELLFAFVLKLVVNLIH